MSLADLIRKPIAGSIATAIAATPAIRQPDVVGTVARIATVAIANSTTQEADQWRAFEMLLAIVGPAYKTPEDEYAQIRAMARHDLSGALICYRELLKQLVINEVPNE